MARGVAAAGLAIALAVLPLAAHGATAVTHLPGSMTLPAWSPDGKHIAWMQANGPFWETWEARPDGSHPHRIITGPTLSEGAWQLDWLAPTMLAFFGNFSIYVERLGAKPTLVAANVTDEFSSDAAGDRFAYESSPCGGQCTSPSRVVVVDRLTGTRSVVGGETTHYADPTISPDGSRVAFASADGLRVARSDGRAMQLLAPLGDCPQWSPDGRAIAYVGPNGSLRIVPGSGGTSTLLVADGVGCGYAPLNFGWSPDGRWLALLAPSAGARLTLIQVATGRARTLRGFSEVNGFAWSPRSTRLLVVARPRPSACSSLWRIDRNGSHRKLIAHCQ